MSHVNYLAGVPEIPCGHPLPVYSDEAVSFLADLSGEMMRNPAIRTYPDVMSVAFWCRKANLIKLKEHYGRSEGRLGRGLAFHIAPSNIPVNFAFSYFFSLLAGNANIVRVPSNPFVQISIICGALRQVLPRHPEIERRTAFISYPRSDEITAFFCSAADLRIIWGGDATIAEIRRHPVKPRCIDLTFADRYSVGLLDGEVVLQNDEISLRRLAEGFYNDTYLMDQNACSSPQLILWRNGSGRAKERFWTAITEETSRRYGLQGMTAVDKYTHLCEDAIDHPEVERVIRQAGNLLYRAELSVLPKQQKTDLRGYGGYFYEYDLRSLNELCAIVDEKYQTLTYYGVPAESLQRLVLENRLRGIDRIVPVGAAMDIGVIWDGYDLITMLSRIVNVI